jgi:hypothetical protein
VKERKWQWPWKKSLPKCIIKQPQSQCVSAPASARHSCVQRSSPAPLDSEDTFIERLPSVEIPVWISTSGDDPAQARED